MMRLIADIPGTWSIGNAGASEVYVRMPGESRRGVRYPVAE